MANKLNNELTQKIDKIIDKNASGFSQKAIDIEYEMKTAKERCKQYNK